MRRRELRWPAVCRATDQTPTPAASQLSRGSSARLRAENRSNGERQTCQIASSDYSLRDALLETSVLHCTGKSSPVMHDAANVGLFAGCRKLHRTLQLFLAATGARSRSTLLLGHAEDLFDRRDALAAPCGCRRCKALSCLELAAARRISWVDAPWNASSRILEVIIISSKMPSRPR